MEHIYKIAITLMLVMMLIASAHYVWYRWECEVMKVEILRYQLIKAGQVHALDLEYYKAELEKYLPPQIPEPEVKE